MLNWWLPGCNSTYEKSNKNILKSLSNARAYLHVMAKTAVKFQKIRNKTAGAVGHTRYLLL